VSDNLRDCKDRVCKSALLGSHARRPEMGNHRMLVYLEKRASVSCYEHDCLREESEFDPEPRNFQTLARRKSDRLVTLEW
jgi:hypothetical protein